MFLGDGTKAIVFYIGPGVGASINAVLAGQVPARPLTHDLFLLSFEAFGAKVKRAVIVRMENEVYYARLIVEAENEIMERKIVELDARPSDSIALAVQQEAPIYIAARVWDEVEDMTEVLQKMEDRSFEEDNPPD